MPGKSSYLLNKTKALKKKKKALKRTFKTLCNLPSSLTVSLTSFPIILPLTNSSPATLASLMFFQHTSSCFWIFLHWLFSLPETLCSYLYSFSPSFILSHEKWKLLSRVQLFVTPWTVQGPDWILQARILVCVAFPFSRGSSRPRNQTRVSCIEGRFFTKWVIREALVYLIYAPNEWRHD